MNVNAGQVLDQRLEADEAYLANVKRLLADRAIRFYLEAHPNAYQMDMRADGTILMSLRLDINRAR